MLPQKNYNNISELDTVKEDWMNGKWRPMMGWVYIVVCICDFVVFPVLWGILHATVHSAQITQWNPLTLQGAGLFHIAMGTVLGVAAWGRTQEKLVGITGGGFIPSPKNYDFESAPTNFNRYPQRQTMGTPVPMQHDDPIL